MSRIRRILLAALALFGLSTAFLFYAAGQNLALLSHRDCYIGWTETRQEIERQQLEREFPELKPQTYKLAHYSCDGFQDLSISAALTLSAEAGQSLVDALEASYNRPSLHSHFDDADRARQADNLPTGKQLTYRLAGSGVLYTRTMVLRSPVDPDTPWQVTFQGSQW